MVATKLTTKGQVVIPKVVRERMGLQPGQRFTVVEKGDVISLVPFGELRELRGLLAGADTSRYRDRSDQP